MFDLILNLTHTTSLCKMEKLIVMLTKHKKLFQKALICSIFLN